MVIQNPRDLFAEMPVKIKKITLTPNFALQAGEAHIKWRGVQILFENGRVLSIQASPLNYSSNRKYSDFLFDGQVLSIPLDIENWLNVAETVEIATWDEASEPYAMLQELPGGDTVAGWVNESDLVRFMSELLAADVQVGYPIPNPAVTLAEFCWS